ncbi:hypothetical protein OSB04_014846 [Centaurea solstitialis]|uniref:DUF7887 domain-containing protein n=1 Tax=Centaurea solstitialis TaxID=347529 RepID=A0AA38TB96_9ASTR|nr:hypothetical protein OSB04_014846 [Centaurea solstitialis]
MVTTQKSIEISTNIFSSMVKNNMNGIRRRRYKASCISMAKKDDDFSQNSTPNYSIKIASQAAIAVLGLGFIDAGYSGDWSRIGVISKENEDLLKAAAFLVVPLCIFLIFSISKATQDD